MGDPSANNAACIGLEVSANRLTAVCVGENGLIKESASADVDYSRSIVDQIVEFLNGLTGEFANSQKLGIAVPALVDSDGRTILYSTHIAEFSKLDLASAIEAATALKVTVENDANCGAVAEYAVGAGRGAKSMFYATLGTGVGGAFVLNGEIWRGNTGFAGEIGYVPVGEEDAQRLEDVASTSNIIRRTRSRVKQDSTSSLSDLDPNVITIADIVEAAKAGDDFSLLMLERTGIYIGTAIASVLNLMNVSTVVLGGAIMDGGELILDPVIDTVKKNTFAPAFESATIVKGTLGRQAAAIGAALIA